MWSEFISTFFSIEVVVAIWPHLLSGLWMTLILTALSVPLAIIVGLFSAVACDVSGRHVRAVLLFVVDVLRAAPPLVLLIFLYYALPLTGLRLTEFFAAILALVLNGGAYFAEAFRTGLETVPKGQREAARSTGLSAWQTMRLIVVPQGTRNVLPDLISNGLELTKQTSIASVVAIQELVRVGQIAQGTYFSPTPIIAVSIIYLILLLPIVRLLSTLQNKSAAVRH